ncbi:fatty acid desaturase [Cohnella sp. JJ-181]|uniref:fatty acid desaturase n=1 Tax=Cohnella rhizoplanae TaxID=2974897 RepID=UPI0022FF724F|nr:fatty acid desaturase [Cohnella sp. JJ-181]CAI6083828.1 hypothetical protein COHCIP112018_04140 [Cohnella sp. JJ-181]
MTRAVQRDYSILGPERDKAIVKGLVSAEWYQTPVRRDRLKALMRRRNGRAARDTLLWLSALGATGWIAWLSWGTWWSVLAFALYGGVYTTSATSKWHEFCHGTPFRTAWLNEAIYQVCSCLILYQATGFRWSHVRHHSDTIIVGSDPEINEPRPARWRRLLRQLLRDNVFPTFNGLLLHALGRMKPAERELIPASEHRKLFNEARAMLAVYAALIAICFATSSVAPLLFVGLPAFYGAYLNALLIWTQHLGLYEDTLDHRLCTRTFYANPVLRFLYTNMNYHVEHHMYPMVPYYNLPALHEEIKHDCPAPAPSFSAAVRETVAALRRIRRDPDYIVPRVRAFAETAAGRKEETNDDIRTMG